MTENISKLVKIILPISFAITLVAIILSIVSMSLKLDDYSIWILASQKTGTKAVDSALVMGTYIPIMNIFLALVVMFLQFGQYKLFKEKMKVEDSSNIFILVLSIIVLSLALGSIICAANATNESWLLKHGESFY